MKGIILDVSHAATLNVEMQNQKLEQAIRIIDEIESPAERASLYKKVFSDCCDVPQSGCECNHKDA